jgi:exodeoxyribonuclease VII small subunit
MSKEKNFEEKMKTLEELISALENGEFGLDESIEKYTEAMKLIRECDKELKSVEDRISKIVTEDGEKDFKLEEE